MYLAAWTERKQMIIITSLKSEAQSNGSSLQPPHLLPAYCFTTCSGCKAFGLKKIWISGQKDMARCSYQGIDFWLNIGRCCRCILNDVCTKFLLAYWWVFRCRVLQLNDAKMRLVLPVSMYMKDFPGRVVSSFRCVGANWRMSLWSATCQLKV